MYVGNHIQTKDLPLYEQIANFILNISTKYPYGNIPIRFVTNKFGLSKDEFIQELVKLNSQNSSLYSQVISILNI